MKKIFLLMLLMAAAIPFLSFKARTTEKYSFWQQSYMVKNGDTRYFITVYGAVRTVSNNGYLNNSQGYSSTFKDKEQRFFKRKLEEKYDVVYTGENDFKPIVSDDKGNSFYSFNEADDYRALLEKRNNTGKKIEFGASAGCIKKATILYE